MNPATTDTLARVLAGTIVLLFLYTLVRDIRAMRARRKSTPFCVIAADCGAPELDEDYTQNSFLDGEVG